MIIEDNMKLRLTHVINLAISIIFLFCIVSCARFQHKDFPTYSYSELGYLAPHNKPTLDYDFVTNLPTPLFGGINYYENNNFTPTLRECNFFSAVNTGIGGADYHFSFELTLKPNVSFIGLLSTVLCTLTVGIIPAHVSHEYFLTVYVNKNNNLLKSYNYKVTVSTWTQLFLIFYSSSDESKESSSIATLSRKTINNMILAFLHDLGQDKILER